MRVTVDVDFDKLKAVRAFYNLKYALGNCQIRSSSRRGWHLRSFGAKDWKTVMTLRMLAGDDEARLKFDEVFVWKPKQVLWTSKEGRFSSEWHDDIWEVLV